MAGKPSIVVISLGGSFLFSKRDKVKRLKAMLHDSDLKFVIVVGGGELAREYISFARSIGVNGDALHEIGIRSTRLNAFIISEFLGCDYYSGDPRRIGRVARTSTMTMGGYKPGWTTDVCAAYACASAGSKVLFNISREKGVFDRDPRKFRNARLIREMRFSDLYHLTRGMRKPGMNYIFDPLAAKVCESKGIEVVVTNQVGDINRYMDGLRVNGTTIRA